MKNSRWREYQGGLRMEAAVRQMRYLWGLKNGILEDGAQEKKAPCSSTS